MTSYDYLIVGSGIIGMAIARTIKANEPSARIIIIEKEEEVAFHASSRNSGVLHAGFYYTADSLKAKFTVAGNKAMRAFCAEKGLPVNTCGKLVVAQNEFELEQLYELERRGKRNGSNVRLIDAAEAETIEPNIQTYKHALYSPDTASVDPRQLCLALKSDLQKQGVDFRFHTAYVGHSGQTIITKLGEFTTKRLINCAGLYADKIAHEYGFGLDYTIIPFKGLYLKYTKNKTDVRINIYPVPNLNNPFLGVHFTKTVNGDIKIGPTAIPAFWRENYTGLDRFNWEEFSAIAWEEAKLFATNAFHFRNLAYEEMRKYQKKYFVGLAQSLVKSIDPDGFTEYTKPGIRAQLLDKRTLKLVQDFVVEADGESVHILNAVSPAFTCAFPFTEHVYKTYLKSLQ